MFCHGRLDMRESNFLLKYYILFVCRLRYVLGRTLQRARCAMEVPPIVPSQIGVSPTDASMLTSGTLFGKPYKVNGKCYTLTH